MAKGKGKRKGQGKAKNPHPSNLIKPNFPPNVKHWTKTKSHVVVCLSKMEILDAKSIRYIIEKCDDGHKTRLKLLEKQMVQAIEILNAVQVRAFDLYMVNNPAREWVKSFRTTPLIPTSSKDEDLLAIKSITNSIEPTGTNATKRAAEENPCLPLMRI
ncbi:hypothetical protein GG344DRAFT_65805 [Lentinula edodes]|nr:hypothetical protein GG344DRAFT_65805 [Lentinula edodes]